MHVLGSPDKEFQLLEHILLDQGLVDDKFNKQEMLLTNRPAKYTDT